MNLRLRARGRLLRRHRLAGVRGRLIRSASVRLAGAYGLVFGLSAVGLVLVLWWASAGLLDRQVEAAIRADAQGLAERWDEGGLPVLILTIQERLSENVDDDALYLLVDSGLNRIAGNLEAWPRGVVVAGAWYELSIQRAGLRSIATVQRFDLPGGFRLLVGRDTRTRVQLRHLLTDALLWALAVVLLLGVAGALLLRGLFRNMVASVSRTATAIAGGDLGQRVALTGRDDEFDRMASAINVMLDRITRLMDGVREVSNAIAHDLRTPITRARARLEDAAGHADGEPALRAAVERAVADLDGVTAVFEALLRIAEIEAGARRSAFAELDLAPLLADLVELYAAAAEEHGIRLRLACPDTLSVFGDRSLIQQAVANLLDNALKFTPDGTAVTLSVTAEADGTCITVADQGFGIPPEDVARAAQRFFRGEQARHTPGSGLGLALVQAVAQLHDGELLLEPAVPNGRPPGLAASVVLRSRQGA